MEFKDHFSGHAANYADARPRYPPELFAFLATQCPERQLACDCGTGNGQAALALAAHFKRVVATDASQAQLDQAPRHPRVEFLYQAAETIALPAGSVDLVTVAQALHWFVIERFFESAEAVLKTEGILAIWSYGMATVSPSVDVIVHYLYEDILGQFWPSERRLVETGYSSINFPFSPLPTPALSMECKWSLQQLLDYLLSWSATRRYMEVKGSNPLDLVRAELGPAWGDAPQRVVRWPLNFRVSRK